jgi:predicted protein tyrosine phosphatase
MARPIGQNGAVMANFDLKVCGLVELESVSGHWHLFASFVDPNWLTNPGNSRLTFSQRAIFRFDDVICDVPGKVLPSRNDIGRWISNVREMDTRGGASMLINCHLGLSRSVAAAAIAIVTLGPAELPKVPEILHSLSSKPWPNSRMLAIADEMLELNGRLAAAGLETRLETARRHPNWVDELSATHRAPEVEEVRARCRNLH